MTSKTYDNRRQTYKQTNIINRVQSEHTMATQKVGIQLEGRSYSTGVNKSYFARPFI